MCKCSKILGCLILFILLSFALLVPLIYYVLQANSATSQKLGECQGRMKNLEEQKTTLEMQQDRAKEEGAALKSELLSTTKCLQETQGRLDSCSNRLHILQNNITALRAKITRLGGRDAELEPEERGEQETNLMSGTCSNSSDARERSTLVGNVCGVAGYLPLLALSLTGTLLL